MVCKKINQRVKEALEKGRKEKPKNYQYLLLKKCTY